MSRKEPEPAAPDEAAPASRTAPQGPGATPAPRSDEQHGPRRLDLFPAEAIGRAAEQPGNGAAAAPGQDHPRLSGSALGQARLDEWRDDLKAAQRAQNGDVTPELRELAQRLAQWLIPDEQALERAGRFGTGVLSPLASYLDYVKEAGHGSVGDGGPMSRRAPLMDPRSARREKMVGFCFGACDGRGNEVAVLAVLIDVKHDEKGTPREWRVSTSSGDRGFDQQALGAVEDALRWAPPEAFEGERPAAWSRWALSARAYRYSRPELVLDPLFEPDGKEVEAKSGVLGRTMVSKSAVLVAVRFHQ